MLQLFTYITFFVTLEIAISTKDIAPFLIVITVMHFFKHTVRVIENPVLDKESNDVF